MKLRTLLVGAVAGLVLTACGGGSSPEDTTKAFAQALADGNCDKAMEMAVDNAKETVQGSIDAGCEKYDTLNINVTDIDCINAPTAFTPDGDGYNDTWILENMENYPEAIVSVFNTWGNKVFESNGIYQPWDGTFNGKKLPAATYYYVINLNNGTAPYSGAITSVILE